MTLKLDIISRSTGEDAVDLRKQGKIPAVVYGSGLKETVSIAVPAIQFEKISKEAGESSLVELSIDGKLVQALIHEIDRDPVSYKPIHIDFLSVDMNKPVQVGVPIEFVGESPAVKAGGILVKVLHEIEIEGLPADLPSHIEVDISALVDVDSNIQVSDLKAPKGITFVLDGEDVVASIAEAKEEVESSTPVDISSIEVEKKGKDETEAAADAS